MDEIQIGGSDEFDNVKEAQNEGLNSNFSEVEEEEEEEEILLEKKKEREVLDLITQFLITKELILNLVIMKI